MLSEGITKPSQELGEGQMATGSLWSEKPQSQERLAGAQPSEGCRPLCLHPTNAN